MPIDALPVPPVIGGDTPVGISPKALVFGGSGFDGVAVPDGSRVYITAPKNITHTTTGRQFLSGQMVRKYSGGIATFAGLIPNDAPGLSRYDWTYHAKFEIVGAVEQPTSFDFVLLTAGPDVVDGDKLVPVPSSTGTPVSVTVPTSVVGLTGAVTGAQIAADPDVRAASVSAVQAAITAGTITVGAGVTVSTDAGGATLLTVG